jgi:putative sugar O-methyltransferase
MLHDPAFKSIVAEVDASPEIYRPSRFWDHLNSVNTQWLDDLGLANFKRTVAQNYYNWLIVSRRDPQFRAVVRQWLRSPTLRPLLTRMDPPEMLRTLIGLEDHFSRPARLVYRLFVAMLWDVAARDDLLGLTGRLEEPLLGNPIHIVSQGRRISQDLANSIRERSAVARWGLPGRSNRLLVAELGAGYGRLGHVFLSDPTCRYFIFDIPPALYVSQWYLSRLFPERKVFTFRHFDRFDAVAAELEDADIAFLTPNQMAMFPDGTFDVTVSISTLPEMSPAQISNYLAELSRLSHGTIYLKQWRQWFNDKDNFEFTYDRLVLPANWELRHDGQDIVQPLFQERIWTRRGA